MSICQRCASGAAWITKYPDDAGVYFAKVLHAECAGPTHCCCQHRVDAQVAGKAVQR